MGDYATTAGLGAAAGAIAGGGISAAGHGLARAVGPWATDAAQRLYDRGIRLTPGQMVGGDTGNVVGRAVGSLEDAATSIPVVGSIVRARRQDALEDFNRTAINDVLEPLGAHLPAGVPMGREAIQHAHQEVSDAYNAIVPQLRARVDNNLVRHIGRVAAMVPQHAQTQLQWRDYLQRHIYDVSDANGNFTGRAIQQTIQGLRRDATNLQTAPGSTAYDRDLGHALNELADAFIQNVEQRSSPAVTNRFRDVNNASQCGESG